MKFGQLIGYKIRNVFLKKNHAQSMVETLFPDPFLENQNWEYIWINKVSKVLCIFFIVCQLEDHRKWLKLRCRPLAFTSNKAFLKNKKRSGSSLPASFSAWFLKKTFLMLYSLNWPNFIAWRPLCREILGNICIVIVINFEINLLFLIKPFFYMTKKSRQKCKYLENEKNF